MEEENFWKSPQGKNLKEVAFFNEKKELNPRLKKNKPSKEVKDLKGRKEELEEQ